MDTLVRQVLTHFDSDGDNSVQTVINKPAKLLFLEASNINVDDAWIQFFEIGTSITVGTTVPKFSILVPGGDSVVYGNKVLNLMVEGLKGIKFDHQLRYACTTTPTGNGDPTTGLTLNIFYLPI